MKMKSVSLLALCVMIATFGVLVAAKDDDKEKAIQKDRKQYEGTWRATAVVLDGKELSEDDAKKITVVNTLEGKWTRQLDGATIAEGTSTLDPTQKTKTIDFTADEGKFFQHGQKYPGIYELGEKTRKLCFAKWGQPRPTEFDAKLGSGRTLVTFKRDQS